MRNSCNVRTEHFQFQVALWSRLCCLTLFSSSQTPAANVSRPAGIICWRQKDACSTRVRCRSRLEQSATKSHGSFTLTWRINRHKTSALRSRSWTIASILWCVLIHTNFFVCVSQFICLCHGSSVSLTHMHACTHVPYLCFICFVLYMHLSQSLSCNLCLNLYSTTRCTHVCTCICFKTLNI